jgi:hypothetical protein
MARRVAAIFVTRDAAEQAAADLVRLGADREQISTLARGEAGQVAERPLAGAAHGEHIVESAREVGDSGAALTTTDAHDATKGATVGAVAGLAAGLLALTVPGIGLVLAAGPLALAAASGAIAGGVFGGLKDLGIDEQYARGYEESIRGGRVLLTAVIPATAEGPARAALDLQGAQDVSFGDDTATTASRVAAA